MFPRRQECQVDDSALVDYVADELAALPGVLSVSLGGSRVSGSHEPTSDWDFALYYRDRFDPGSLRALGWEGTVSEIGGWGGGVFNGGAWLEIEPGGPARPASYRAPHVPSGRDTQLPGRRRNGHEPRPPRRPASSRIPTAPARNGSARLA
ncbi:nucleotidyltransferase domain-containing protein [Arthrobacter sp. ISL-72]|uniref:nucleotidyltransferase domain-containing protein n=1 Tax=Arthrobacter sp. ISL-72 TaxID=2819114 RepID=UPI0037C082B7